MRLTIARFAIKIEAVNVKTCAGRPAGSGIRWGRLPRLIHPYRRGGRLSGRFVGVSAPGRFPCTPCVLCCLYPIDPTHFLTGRERGFCCSRRDLRLKECQRRSVIESMVLYVIASLVVGGAAGAAAGYIYRKSIPVSYKHLTLPTICSV